MAKNKVSKKEPQRTEDVFDQTDNRPNDIPKRSKNQEVEKWLEAGYKFRFNTIKQKPEYKLKEEISAPFAPIDKYKLLSVKRELDAAGHTISKDGLLDILCSSFAPPVNPVKEYFKNLDEWDESTDYIAELANTVKARNQKHWLTYFKKWLVAVVANVFIDERCANHTMLVLTGSQGKFKTTWLENLTPKSLTQYLYSGKLDPQSKDSLTLIAEYLFINIDDQLKQLHKKDENELKNLITSNFVKYRKPYDPIITEYPHLCSFVGSVNGNEFLNDPTGSRRFLPFEVENINIKEAQALDMDKVWSQATTLFYQKFRYWFQDEEIDEINANNSEFSMISQEEEFLGYYFANTPPKGSLTGLKFYPSAVILSKIEMQSRGRLSAKKLGEALHKLGFEKKQKMIDNQYKWGYYVYEKETEEIQKQQFEDKQTAL